MQTITLLLTALLSAAVLAAPAPGLGEVPAALEDRSPQECVCGGWTCWDICGQPFCC